ncbi:hypothetical protein [Tissierella sp. Yu-01]|nr:hypothetical protein [Tissierella sp. Yu-01]WFA09224.1 hypothetical protein P3962_01240 [Tissierella sp. Yu-01]
MKSLFANLYGWIIVLAVLGVVWYVLRERIYIVKSLDDFENDS